MYLLHEMGIDTGIDLAALCRIAREVEQVVQRPLPGQSGAQYFFTEADRAFCLYVVLGSHARRRQLVPEVNLVLSTLSLS